MFAIQDEDLRLTHRHHIKSQVLLRTLYNVRQLDSWDSLAGQLVGYVSSRSIREAASQIRVGNSWEMMLMPHACTQMHLHTYILMNTCWYARACACTHIHAHIHHLEPYGKFIPLLITQPQILSYNNRKIPRRMLTLWIVRSKPSPIPHYILKSQYCSIFVDIIETISFWITVETFQYP